MPGVLSFAIHTNTGAPQGTVLAPFLFIPPGWIMCILLLFQVCHRTYIAFLVCHRSCHNSDLPQDIHGISGLPKEMSHFWPAKGKTSHFWPATGHTEIWPATEHTEIWPATGHTEICSNALSQPHFTERLVCHNTVCKWRRLHCLFHGSQNSRGDCYIKVRDALTGE